MRKIAEISHNHFGKQFLLFGIAVDVVILRTAQWYPEHVRQLFPIVAHVPLQDQILKLEIEMKTEINEYL